MNKRKKNTIKQRKKAGNGKATHTVVVKERGQTWKSEKTKQSTRQNRRETKEKRKREKTYVKPCQRLLNSGNRDAGESGQRTGGAERDSDEYRRQQLVAELCANAEAGPHGKPKPSTSDEEKRVLLADRGDREVMPIVLFGRKGGLEKPEETNG